MPPTPPIAPDPPVNAVNGWLDALVEAIADLSPDQRVRLWRRLSVAGLLPSVGAVTDRGRLDLARGVKVAQSRFYYLVGPGARLESALMNLALAKAHAWGFVQLSVPTLVNPAVMAGAGFLDAHADEV